MYVCVVFFLSSNVDGFKEKFKFSTYTYFFTVSGIGSNKQQHSCGVVLCCCFNLPKPGKIRRNLIEGPVPTS